MVTGLYLCHQGQANQEENDSDARKDEDAFFPQVRKLVHDSAHDGFNANHLQKQDTRIGGATVHGHR